MATWPSTVPAWLMGVGIEIAPVLRSGVKGYGAQRRVTDRRNDILSVALSLTAAEFTAFETFVQTDLNQGADQFTGPYYDGAGYQTGTVQLVGGSYTATWNGTHFDVAAQLQVFGRTDPRQEDIAAALTYDTTIENLFTVFDALENAVNNNNL